MAKFVSSSGLLHPPMLHRLLITALIFFTNVAFAEEIFLNVNVKKPLAVTSDKFLSYTLDPKIVLTGNALTRNPEKSVNMGRALSPAYVRIGGPRSNSFTFVRPHHPRYEEDPNFIISETNWIDVHRWAKNASLDIVACIASQHIETRGGDSVWDSRNALDLISFSDEMGFNTSWQLGYECQTRCDGTGIDIGRAVTRLRSMLDAFPRYSESFITGPDIVTYRTRQQQQYLQDYFNVGGNALSAITWHPNFSGVTLDAEGVSIHHDNLGIDRDVIYRLIGRSIWKKPLWLAESKPEECKKQFLGALVWTKRLGNAAKLGVQVIMRQPDDSDLLRPSPDYWVSVLHKTLVGREVLDTRITNGNRTHVDFYCHCTRTSSKYEKGSLTIFGINLTPTKISVGLRGLKITTIHKYILLPGYDAENRMFSETVLLNDEPLNLIDDKELPPIKPAVSINNSKGVALNLPSGGIGFWVLPDVKIRSCGGVEEDNAEKTLTKKIFKRYEDADFNEDAANNADRKREKNNEESSAEERRHFSKSHKSSRRQRKNYHSEEEDIDRRQKRFEARNDFERLEKLLRRRDWYVDRKSSSGKRTVRFNFYDNDEVKLANDNDLDDSAIIKIQDDLEEYKKRLSDYEDERADSRASDEIIDKTDNEKVIDAKKFIEAIELLVNLKNPLEKFERSKTNDNMTSFDQYRVNLTSNFVNSSNDTRDDYRLFDKSMKFNNFFERISDIPIQIVNKLPFIRRISNDEQNNESQRNNKTGEIIEKKFEVERSDINNVDKTTTSGENDEKFDSDLLGLQKERTFDQVSRFIEEMRDRRYRRRAKNNGDDGQLFAFGSRANLDNEENHFHDFDKPELIESFDAINDDDETRRASKTAVDSGRNGRLKVPPCNHGDNWNEDEKTPKKYMPTEFIETFEKIQVPCEGKNFNEWELSEAELFNRRGNTRSNIDKDEAVNWEEIIQGNGNAETRNSSGKVKKPIGFNEDPRIDEDKRDECDEARSIEHMRAKASTNDDWRIDEAAIHRIKKESVEDLTSGEIGNSADFTTAMHFNSPTPRSVKEAAIENRDVTYRIVDMSPERTKRSTDIRLEDTLDREMMFQADGNFRDDNCRVTRSKRTVKAGGNNKRENRRNKQPRGKRLDARNKRRINRKRSNSTTMKLARDPEEISTVATRQKRNVDLPHEERTESTNEEHEFTGDSENASKSTTIKSIKSEKAENLLKEMENSSNDDNAASDELNTDYETTTNDIDDYSSSSFELERNNGIAESSTLNEDLLNIAIESEALGVNNVVKRQNEETTLKNISTLEDETAATENSAERSGTMESSTLKDFTEAVDENLESGGTISAKFSRGRKNKKDITEKPKRSRRINPTKPSGTTVFPDIEVSQTSSIDDSTSVEALAVATIATDEASSPDITSVTAEASTTKKDEENLSNVETSTLNEIRDKAERKFPKIDAKRMENGTAMIKKRSQRIRKAPKASYSVKIRGTQKFTSPSISSVENKDNDEERAKKLKRNEQTEKLRKKLVQKREKRLNDHHEPSEFEMADEKVRRLKRREIIGMIMNDENFRDLIDGEKFDDLKRNRPINYEATEDSRSVEYAQDIGEKYVPEIFEIVRPPHVTRERKIQSRNPNVRANVNERLLSYAVPRAASEKIRRRNDDPMDHKINTNGDEEYYSASESLENPRISEQSAWYENEFDEKTAMSMKSSIESDESPIISSSEYDDRELAFNNDEGKLFHSKEESVRNRNIFQNGKEDFSESSDEFSKSVEENKYIKAMPINNLWFDKTNHASKKRNLKNSDYELDANHDSPRYERLARDDVNDRRNSRVLDSGETFQRIVWKKSPIDKRMRENSEEEKSPAIIDHADLDEAIKSGNYELLLLIPAIKNQMSRRKRHVDNEVTRHQENSITNDITLEMAQKNNMLKARDNKMEEMRLDDEILMKNINERYSLRKPSLNISSERKNDENLTIDSSTNVMIEKSKSLGKNNGDILNENERKIISERHEEFMDDQSLPDFLEGTIPKLEATVTGGLGKIRRISESFEKFIDEFDDGFNKEEVEPQTERYEEDDFSMSNKVFRSASTSVKKFFDFISGLLHIFQQN